MGPVEYYPILIQKNIYQILLLLQNRIIIPLERIFMYKITLASGALIN